MVKDVTGAPKEIDWATWVSVCGIVTGPWADCACSSVTTGFKASVEASGGAAAASRMVSTGESSSTFSCTSSVPSLSTRATTLIPGTVSPGPVVRTRAVAAPTGDVALPDDPAGEVDGAALGG